MFIVIKFYYWNLKHNLIDRKSTRLNSSHANISYAVFCLKKKKKTKTKKLQLETKTMLSYTHNYN